MRRASTVIAVSDYLRRELEERVPRRAARRRSSTRASTSSGSGAVAPAAELEQPAFVHVGSLTERKNVVRLADAFATLGRGSLTFVGDGPLRGQLEGRAGVRVVGRVPHDEVPGWLAPPTSSAGRR